MLEELVRIMLQSGKAGLDLALYTLLPVLVIMMAIMKVIEARGMLALVARALQPALRLFGIPGAGVFAILQMLLVSFAAPLATLTIMEKDGTSRRHIAATLAMVLTLSQANVVFPMVAAGLNLGAIMMTSIVGGVAAAALTYYLFARSAGDESLPSAGLLPVPENARKASTLNLLKEGTITVQELNRMAGFITNPCDLVGVAVLISAGTRCASVMRPAIAGAVARILIRGILHLLIF